jgi:ribosomal protein S27AE
MQIHVWNGDKSVEENPHMQAHIDTLPAPPDTDPPYKEHKCTDGSVMTFTKEEFEQLEPAALGLYAHGDRFLEHRLCPNCGSTLCIEHQEFNPNNGICQKCGGPPGFCVCSK